MCTIKPCCSLPSGSDLFGLLFFNETPPLIFAVMKTVMYMGGSMHNSPWSKAWRFLLAWNIITPQWSVKVDGVVARKSIRLNIKPCESY